MKAIETAAEKVKNATKIPTDRDFDMNAIKEKVDVLLVDKSFQGHRTMIDVQKDIEAIKQYENDVYGFLEVAEVVPVEVDELLITIQETLTDLRFEKREIEFWIRKNANQLTA